MSSDLKFHQQKNEFYNFLRNSYPVDNSLKPTHTSMGDHKGSFYINDEYQEHFYNIYCQHCFYFKIDLHLTESHKETSPVLVDLDFRYDVNNSSFTRKFDLDFIKLNGDLSYFNAYSLPTTVVFDKSGNEAFRLTGGVDFNTKNFIDRILNIEKL